MRLGYWLGAVTSLVVLASACSSSSDSGSSSSGKPSDSAGCNAFCVAQSKLSCGMPVATCYDLCRAAAPGVAGACKSEYEADEVCQSKNLSCSGKTLLISDCTNETAAYAACASDGGVGDAGTD